MPRESVVVQTTNPPPPITPSNSISVTSYNREKAVEIEQGISRPRAPCSMPGDREVVQVIHPQPPCNLGQRAVKSRVANTVGTERVSKAPSMKVGPPTGSVYIDGADESVSDSATNKQRSQVVPETPINSERRATDKRRADTPIESFLRAAKKVMPFSKNKRPHTVNPTRPPQTSTPCELRLAPQPIVLGNMFAALDVQEVSTMPPPPRGYWV